jgi:hypothetical protein
MKGRTLSFIFIVLFGLCVLSSWPANAQNKTACELLSKADAEAVLGVTLQPPESSAPFRSLLDPDFTEGTPEQGCRFTNLVPNQPKPSKVVCDASTAGGAIQGQGPRRARSRALPRTHRAPGYSAAAGSAAKCRQLRV